MKSTLSILLFISLSICSLAQPGFMGRRFSLGYDLYFKPAFQTWFNEYSDAKFGSRFHSAHQFQGGYVLNRKHEIYAAYMIGKFQDYNEDYLMNGSNFADLRMKGIRLGLRKFGGNSIAPIGFYQDFYWTTQSALYAQPTYVYSLSGNFNQPKVLLPGGSHSVWKLGYGLGRRSILTSTVYIDFGIELQISQYFWDNSEIKNALAAKTVAVYEKGAIKDALVKEGGVYWMHVGIGFLSGKPKVK